jgi:hypothetical protein
MYAQRHCDAHGNLYDGEFVCGLREGAGRYSSAVPTVRLATDSGVLTVPATAATASSTAAAAATAAGATDSSTTTTAAAAAAASAYTYIGEWRAGLRHGVGQCTWTATGDCYSGQWHSDQRCGEGRLTFASANTVYEGQFEADCKHGLGSLTTSEGHVFEGDWCKDVPTESADWRIRFVSGDAYVGDVKLVRHSSSTSSSDSPCTTAASANNGSSSSSSNSTSSSSAAFSMVPHGVGTYKYANGDVYTGSFSDGLRSGSGLCVFANGERFEGQWHADAISLLGTGRLTLADGTTHDYT